MIEGILKRSKCTYAPEVTDYRCDVLQNSSDQNYPNFWPIPLPKDGIFEARTIHVAKPLQKDQLPSQPVSGILSISSEKYANENVYMLPDYKACAPPVCGPKFVRSATVNLAALLNTVVQVDGRFYYVDGAVFIDVTSVNNPSPTPQPTCIPFPKECLNPQPRDSNDPNAGMNFCSYVWLDQSPIRGQPSQYCPPPCTPLGEEILLCMRGGKSLDDCTATMGAPLLPWCRPTPTPTPPGCYYQQVQCFKAPCESILVCPTPTPTQDNCNSQPEGSSCTISDCPVCDSKSGRPCPLRACKLTQGTCLNRICTPNPTPTPTSQCDNQPNGSQCWISGFCPPPPPCTPPGPCATQACAVNPGICQNGTCISTPTPTTKPTNSCNGTPDGVSCTRTVCRPQRFFGSFGDFLPERCEQLPGICQYNTCIEPPKPTLTSCKQGDINRDGTVDTQDLGYILVNFLKHVPELNIPTVDINGDGVVDLSDYSLFAKDFGTSTGPCI